MRFQLRYVKQALSHFFTGKSKNSYTPSLEAQDASYDRLFWWWPPKLNEDIELLYKKFGDIKAALQAVCGNMAEIGGRKENALQSIAKATSQEEVAAAVESLRLTARLERRYLNQVRSVFRGLRREVSNVSRNLIDYEEVTAKVEIEAAKWEKGGEHQTTSWMKNGAIAMRAWLPSYREIITVIAYVTDDIIAPMLLKTLECVREERALLNTMHGSDAVPKMQRYLNIMANQLIQADAIQKNFDMQTFKQKLQRAARNAVYLENVRLVGRTTVKIFFYFATAYLPQLLTSTFDLFRIAARVRFINQQQLILKKVALIAK